MIIFLYKYKMFFIKETDTFGHISHFLVYGSLYVTLCFVLCPFDFGVLTIEFSVLCTMLHILNVALYEVEPRWRTNEERKTRV